MDDAGRHGPGCDEQRRRAESALPGGRYGLSKLRHQNRNCPAAAVRYQRHRGLCRGPRLPTSATMSPSPSASRRSSS
nr:hypothetical protein [Azospirillum palustre]